MITVNTSYTNLVSQHTLAKNTNALQKATERLSTGARINHAADDAAGVFLDVSLSSQISSMKTANDNTLLATNFLNIANGTLTTVSDCLMRMNDLAVQACSGVMSDEARSTLQNELNSLVAQTNQTMASSSMNGVATIAASESAGGGFINDVEVRSLDELKAAGYVACTANNIANASNTKFYISSVDELQALATATNNGTVATTKDKTFTLADDIDLSSVCSESSGVSWIPIGKPSNYFHGTFDGNGHVISNLYINNPGDSYKGLFGYIENCTIKNLGVENVNVTGQNNVGGLVAYNSYGTIENCYATGNVAGNGAGGLVGYNYGNIESCYAKCNVAGNSTGGLTGYNYGNIENCYATGNVESNSGGLVNYNNGTIENCYATGNVENYSGGLANNNFGTIKNSYATGNVVGTGSGVFGNQNFGTIENCYATGNVTGDGSCGFVNRNFRTIKNSYATGNVAGNDSGGFVNFNNSTIENSYATGLVNGALASEAADKENFDSSVLDTNLWDLSGDNPTLRPSIWASSGSHAETSGQPIRFQIGDTSDANSAIEYDASVSFDFDDLDLSDIESARAALTKIQANLQEVTAKQSYIGTQINRLSDIYNAQQIRIENTSAAKSTISDTDYAKEVANMVKSQILQQISTSVLTQSQNISGKIALSLL